MSSDDVVSVKLHGFEDVVRNLSLQYPELVSRALRSALSSTGWWISREVRNHLEYGGSNWPDYHPMGRRMKKLKDPRAWGVTRSRTSPLFWLGKFARYRVSKKGTAVKVFLGRSRAGQKGMFDPQLWAMAMRHEHGDTITVTDSMRARLGATRSKTRKKDPEPGRDYYPLRADTQEIKIPKRPTFGPVFRKLSPRIGPHMERKFHRAFTRYQNKAR